MKYIMIVSAVLFINTPVLAHSGGLNAEGCHVNRKTGDYHCHSRPRAFALSEAPVKLSQNGICHAPETTYYSRTLHFTRFTSIGQCLAAGGRLPWR